MEIIIIIFCLIFFTLIYLLLRINLVLKYRLDLIYRDYEKYKTVPSYNKMVFHYKPLKDKYWLS